MTYSPSTSYSNISMYGAEWCNRRRLPSCNRIAILTERQLGITNGKGARNYANNDDLVATVAIDRYEKLSDQDQGREPIISWSPSGDRLIALGADLVSIKIYRYLGVQRAKQATAIDIFKSLFSLEAEVRMPRNDIWIRSDTMSFTSDARHLLIGATSSSPAEEHITMNTLNRSNETVPLQHPVEHYYFFSIDVEKGLVCGEHCFLSDRISTVYGVSLSDRHVLVTSIQHQVLHVLQIHSLTGAIVPLKQIGPSVHDDESLHLHTDEPTAFLRTHFFSGLKQRINTFLYRRAKEENRVIEFLRGSSSRAELRIDRAYIFDTFYIFIRMLPNEMSREMTHLPCFHVVLDWRTAEIMEIFEAYDSRYFRFYEEASPSLLMPVTSSAWPGRGRFGAILAMNFNRIVRRSVVKDRSSPECMRRILMGIPGSFGQQHKISMQSPYLDPRLFSCDERFFSQVQMGKVRVAVDLDSVNMYSVRSDRRLFSLPLHPLELPNGARQLSLLFHPTDPLCLAIDRSRHGHLLIIYLPATPSDDDGSPHDEDEADDAE